MSGSSRLVRRFDLSLTSFPLFTQSLQRRLWSRKIWNRVSNEGKNTSMFVPTFPASCPYSTTVGGTKKYAPERWASEELGGFCGGDGFSNRFGALDFVKEVQTSYVKGLGNEYEGLYNKTGSRGYPDVSAQGSKYLIQTSGSPNLVGGTSASTVSIEVLNSLLVPHDSSVVRDGWI